MFTRALGGAAVAIAMVLAVGCSDDTRAPEAAAAQPDTFSEYFVASGDSYVLERVDRKTPESLEASEGQRCFTDPAWVQNGAPYDRGESRPDLPQGTQRGEVNMMKQCDLPYVR
jgi:hypothetical protein